MTKKLTQIFTIGTPSYFAAKTWAEEWLEFYRKSRTKGEYDVIIRWLEFILKIDKETEKMFKEELK